LNENDELPDIEGGDNNSGDITLPKTR